MVNIQPEGQMCFIKGTGFDHFLQIMPTHPTPDAICGVVCTVGTDVAYNIQFGAKANS